jgi:hypothetical protein
MDQYTVFLQAASTPAYTRTLPQANRRRCPLRAHTQSQAMGIPVSLGLGVAGRINTSRGGVRSAIVDLRHLQHESPTGLSSLIYTRTCSGSFYFISFILFRLSLILSYKNFGFVYKRLIRRFQLLLYNTS